MRTLVLSLAFSLAALAQPLDVLIVDGVNNHDWQGATRGIRAILDATGRFRVDVSTSPARDAAPEAWAAWRPDFARYRAVVVNFNGGHLDSGLRWPPEVEAAFLRYLRGGGGVVIFHAANNAFLRWAEYNDIAGLLWRDKSFGPGLVFEDAGKVVTVPAGEGPNPGHGPRHDFQMRVRDKRHPITRGLPELWMHPSEQLTHGQHGPARDLTLLTSAWSKDSHRHEPMDWVRDYGKGRVYVTMLGHTWLKEENPNLDCVGFQTLFARGVEWAAIGRVTLPVPPNFPKPDRVSLKPPR